MTTNAANLRAEIVGMERKVARIVGPHIERLKKDLGEVMAYEVLMSTAALFASRTIVTLGVWTTQPLDKIRRSFDETLDEDVKTTTRKMVDHLKTVGGPSDL